MKIAYQQLDLSVPEVRARLIDDLIVTVGDDDTARQYLEDLLDYMNGEDNG